MNTSGMFGSIALVSAFAFGCHAAGRQPSSGEQTCKWGAELSNDGRSVNIDASSCKASIPEFLGMLEEGKTLTSSRLGKVTSVSIVGPVGSDNLQAIDDAWQLACKDSKNVGASTKGRSFVAHYESSTLLRGLRQLLQRRGKALGKVSVDNFYPLKPKGARPPGSCDSNLPPPVIWLEG